PQRRALARSGPAVRGEPLRRAPDGRGDPDVAGDARRGEGAAARSSRPRPRRRRGLRDPLHRAALGGARSGGLAAPGRDGSDPDGEDPAPPRARPDRRSVGADEAASAPRLGSVPIPGALTPPKCLSRLRIPPIASWGEDSLDVRAPRFV